MTVRRALRVNQWLPEWDRIEFEPKKRQARPEPWFLLLSIPAVELRRLAAVEKRQTSPLIPGASETGIQRGLQSSRAEEIGRYVRSGYPMSTLRGNRLVHADDALRKPGWLASSIIVNILPSGEQKDGRRLHADDAIRVVADSDDPAGSYLIHYPTSWREDWEPLVRAPMQVIDGQHRLWAFSGHEDYENFELPVVAFVDLDLAWQAYLFWTVNIKPKRISPSLAYDLYPLLREQEWLDAGEGLAVYRETRAQEIVEGLYSYPSSPWFGRINMLGDSGRSNAPVTQAGFVRSLTSSYVRAWDPGQSRVGGFFGGSETGAGLAWNRLQQTSFVVELWALLEARLRDRRTASGISDSSHLLSPDGQPSLIPTDQGVRCVLQVTNDILRTLAADVLPVAWEFGFAEESFELKDIDLCVSSLRSNEIHRILDSLATVLAGFDWRTQKAAGLTDTQRDLKSAYRGSGGYALLRRHVLEHVATDSDRLLAKAAESLLPIKADNE